MAKAAAPTALAVANTTLAQELEVLKSLGLDPEDVTGKENLTQDDLRLSRLAIAQKMSHELDAENEAKFIDGLKEGDFYDTETRENYGPGPLAFTLIAPVRKHAKILDAEGNVLEWDVPFDDPRCEFTTGTDGKRVPPVATRFYDFLVTLHDYPSEFPVVISMKRTQVPVARGFMTLYGKKLGPVFAWAYSVRTVSQEGAKGKFKNYSINFAGPSPQAIVELAKRLHEKFKTAKYTVAEAGVTGEGADAPPF